VGAGLRSRGYARHLHELLDRIDAYCDAVPRSAARAEEHGALVLFMPEPGAGPYYARPSRGAGPATAAEVRRVRERQGELVLPEQLEWIADVDPELRDAAVAAGLRVTDHPLMVLDGEPLRPHPPAADVELRLASPADDVALISAVADVGFAHPGTAAGGAGMRELQAAAASRSAERTSRERARLEAGTRVLGVAFWGGLPVTIGLFHEPIAGVTEIAAVATLPRFRRRGLGAAVTAFLATEARRQGADTIFLSAGDDEIARVYGGLGFVRVGTACIATPGEA
jgi:GNAT superfamily N-acetyltransferase